MVDKERTLKLSEVPLLSNCSQRELQRVAKVTDEVIVPAGTTLIEQGQLGREAFVIVDGTAAVRRNGRKVAVVGPGECVGEMSLLDRQPRSASVVAMEEMTVLVIPSRSFSALLDDTPSLTRKLLQNLATRVRDMDSRLTT